MHLCEDVPLFLFFFLMYDDHVDKSQADENLKYLI